ncbi:MAG: DNA alkylation repair enzyme, partial [Rikenellaceae bacterium]|nr:DNA alkylation repair enzyme [Rikenellaceae bacterium]
YAALMAVARRQQTIDAEVVKSIKDIVRRHSSSRIIAQGAVALLSAAAHNAELAIAIKESLTTLGEGSAADYIREEMEWRLEALQ